MAVTKLIIVVVAALLLVRLARVLRAVELRINGAKGAERRRLTVKFLAVLAASALPSAAAFCAILMSSLRNSPAGWTGVAEICGAILLMPALLPMLLRKAALIPGSTARSSEVS